MNKLYDPVRKLLAGLLFLISFTGFSQNYVLYQGGPTVTLPSRGIDCVNGTSQYVYDQDLQQSYYQVKGTRTYKYYVIGGTHYDSYTIQTSSPTTITATLQQDVYTKTVRGDNATVTWNCTDMTPTWYPNGGPTFMGTTATGTITATVVNFSFNQPQLTVCSNSSSIDLSSLIYATGTTFSGRGVSGNYFYPNQAGVSDDNGWTITASNTTFSNASTSSPALSTLTIIVRPTYSDQESQLGSMLLVNSLNFCQDANTVDLTKYVRYNTTSDQFTWQGGSGKAFTPNALGSGNFTITYTYKNGYNCTSTYNLPVKIDPTFTVDAGPDTAYCISHTPISLIGNPSGTWSGAGIDSSGVFTPSAAGSGPHSLTLTATQGACTKSDQVSVYVYALPSVSAGADLEFCKDAGIKQLNTIGVAPQNGTWSFTQNSYNRLINDTSQSVDITGLAIGNYELQYSYTDPNGCYNSDTRNLKIDDVLSPPLIQTDAYSCGPGKVLMLIASPQASVSYNWYTDSTSASTLFVGTSYQTPLISQTETYYISAVNTSGCESTKRKVFAEIRDIPTPDAGPVQNVCYGGDTISLTGGVPKGGTYSGTHVTSNTFDPSGLPAGNYNLTYTATVNGCQGSGTKQVIITPPAVIGAGKDKVACFGTGEVDLNDLNVFPAYGTWSFVNPNLSFALTGSLVNVNDLQPNDSGYVVKYSVTDSLGCTSTSEKLLFLYPQPEPPQVPGVSQCGPGQINFTVSNLNTLNTYNWYQDSTSTTPLFTGQSFLSPYIQNTTTFYLQDVNPDGCKSEKVPFEGVIKPVPNLKLAQNTLVCLNTTSLDLDSLVNPIGGLYSGDGVSGKKFYPQIAGIGAHLINYDYINSYGCELKEGFQITVTGSINDSLIGDDTSYCQSHPPINLSTWTTLKGGTFTGPGVENNIFTPSTVNNNSLSIHYELNQDGCTYMDDRNITLITSPAQPVIQGVSDGCIGDILEFSTEKILNLTYRWYLDADTSVFSTDQNINVTVGQVSVVTLVTVNAYHCPSLSPAVVQITNDNPSGTISATATLLNKGDYSHFTFTGTNASQYYWSFGDSGYSVEPSPYHYYYQAPDTFSVFAVISSKQGCTDTFHLNKPVITTGTPYQPTLGFTPNQVFSQVNAPELLAYPVPCSEEITLEFKNPGNYTLSIKNLKGETFIRESHSGQKASLNTSEISSGLYILEIRGDLNTSIKVEKY